MKERILQIMADENYKPLTIDDFYDRLNLNSAAEFTSLAKCLNSLVDEKIIIYNRKGQFAKLAYFKMATGIIDVKEAGFAFVDTELGGIFIPQSSLKGAINYDEVLIKFKTDNKKRLEGEVVRILKRNTQALIGSLLTIKGKKIVKPVDAKLNLVVYISDDNLINATNNDIVMVKITKYYKNYTADGIIKEVYGNKDLPGLDITSLVLTSGVKTTFDEKINAELEEIEDVLDTKSLLLKDPSIRDLRLETIITIDGDDAKDLDDAVNLKKLANGNYLLGVYIADVSNYVKEGSFLDEEALERGTSIYLPDRTIPMLPKKLSNGICSLNEKVDRLVLGCQMEIDTNGMVVNYEVFEAIINNKHRMTYQVVNQILEQIDKQLNKAYQDIVPMLFMMNELKDILHQKRLLRGAFEFDTIEPKIILDENQKAIDIKIRKALNAEALIEEFMLVTNETIAEAMTWLDVPFIYRVHEEPNQEKMTHLLLNLSQFGYQVKIKNQKMLPKILQQILLDLKKPTICEEEKTKYAIIAKLMVRSMAKAKYQETNIGHYGLASKYYTHFTSPIRRYPDLLVHRLVKLFMLGKKEEKQMNSVSYYEAKVNRASLLASQKESQAEMLERNCVDLKKVEYISNYIGKVFYGIIASITPFGMYIMLDNTVEGLVKYKQMNDDYYEVDELYGRVIGKITKKVYQMGDEVRVKVLATDLRKRTVDFKLLGK